MKNPQLIYKISIFIILVLLAFWGVWIYRAFYSSSLDKKTDNYTSLIPVSLQAYNRGKNSDIILIYKNDDQIEKFLHLDTETSFPTPLNLLGYYSETLGAGTAIMDFKNDDQATEALLKIEDLIAKTPKLKMMEDFIEYRLDNNILIVNFGGGIGAFSGPTEENPLIQTFDLNTNTEALTLLISHQKALSVNFLVLPLMQQLSYALYTPGPLTTSSVAPAEQKNDDEIRINLKNKTTESILLNNNSSSNFLSALTKALSATLALAKQSMITISPHEDELSIKFQTELSDPEYFSTYMLVLKNIAASSTSPEISENPDQARLLAIYNEQLQQLKDNLKILDDNQSGYFRDQFGLQTGTDITLQNQLTGLDLQMELTILK